MILSASARLCRQFRLHAGGDARFRPLGGRGVRPAARCIGGGGAGAALVAFAFKCNLVAFLLASDPAHCYHGVAGQSSPLEEVAGYADR